MSMPSVPDCNMFKHDDYALGYQTGIILSTINNSDNYKTQDYFQMINQNVL